MTLYKDKYRVESTRLPGWDYSSPGAYFVTICTKKRKCFFGEIIDGKMNLSEMGEIANQYWIEIPDHFDNICLDKFVIMPNHIHGILFINDKKNGRIDRPHSRRDAINRVSTIGNTNDTNHTNGGATGYYNPMIHQNISKIIRWYKGRTSFEIRKNNPEFAWQSRFHDHVIRDENELNRIRQYIVNNPEQWEKDNNYVAEGKS